MSDETRSFRDPLGNHMRALSEEHECYLAQFPRVASLYDGFYLSFVPAGTLGVAYLAGAESIIGSDIRISPRETPINSQEGHPEPDEKVIDRRFPEPTESMQADSDTAAPGAPPLLALLNLNGDVIAHLDEEGSQRLARFIEAGWELRVVLSLVSYNNEIRSFAGELACLCINPALETVEPTQAEALQIFVGHLVERIAAGDHPGLRLTQQQLARVIESGGAWYLTKADPLPEQTRGWAIYKRRKSATDHLVAAALRKNKGCLVASWLGTAVVVALIVWLAWCLIQTFWG